MWMLIVVLAGVTLAQETMDAVPYDGRRMMMSNVNDRTLFIRSLPGYPGARSDLYEVYMEPYYFAMGMRAIVELKALNEEGMPMDGPRGVLTIEQMPNAVRITGSITGLSPGMHGFHLHDKGDLTKGCTSAGPHFNPYMTMHGSPSDPLRHVGDLGNINAGDDGVAQIDVMDHYLTLTGVRGAIGRALVVHEKPDDLGRGGSEDSMKTGSAGARVACGVVGFM